MTDTAFEMPDGLPSAEDLMKILRPEDPATRAHLMLDLTVSTVTRATKLLRAARHEHAAKEGLAGTDVDMSLSDAHDATARALAELMSANSALERVCGLSCTAHDADGSDQ